MNEILLHRIFERKPLLLNGLMLKSRCQIRAL